MPENRNVLVILNPVAGRHKPDEIAKMIDNSFKIGGFDATVLFTNNQGDARQLAHDMAAEYDEIVCGGGDGTLNEVVDGMLSAGVDVPIGYLPLGTTNDFAHTLGIPEQAGEALEIAVNGEPMALDAALWGGERRVCYVASFGAFTGASYSTPQWLKNIMGYNAYLLTGIWDAARIPTRHVVLEADGNVIEGDYTFGSVTNAMVVAKLVNFDERQVCLDDGKFEVMLIRTPKTPHELHETLHALSQRDYSNESITLLHAEKMRFSFDKPIVWTLDGEFAEALPEVEINVLHKAFRIKRRGLPAKG